MSSSPASFYFVVPVTQLSPTTLNNSAFGIAILQSLVTITPAQALAAWNNINSQLTTIYSQEGLTVSAADVTYMTNVMIVIFAKIFSFHSGAFQ